MMLARKIGMRCFATPPKQPVDLESNTIVDPHFYENTNLVARIQNFFENRSALNDIERSFRDFKRSKASARFLTQYNTLVHVIQREKVDELEYLISPSLVKVFKKAIKNKEDLPYYLEHASSCELVQARSYSENLAGVRSTNKWYQLTFKYHLSGGDIAYHIVERNDKEKYFKFIKFHL